MSLTSWTFAALLALAWMAHRVVPRHRRTVVLLAASILFYAWAFPAHALLLAAMGAGTFLAGRAIADAPGRRGVLVASVAGILAALAVFKYSGMAAITASALLGALGMAPLRAPAIVAPLGISYVAFGMIHFLAETYRGRAARPGALEFALYVFFFPTVTAGPIKRYPEFLSDTLAGDLPGPRELAGGVYRIVAGLFKKLVIADTLIVLTGPLTRSPGRGSLFSLIVAIYAYAFVIYFDFSGYSDMAIGIARLFGYRILENFDHPYLRRNLSQFWRHWHMSLTRFITENIYIPLGGSRRGAARTAANTMAAMLLSGLWHGAAWHYALWGGLHGAGMVAQRGWQAAAGALKRRVPALGRAAEHPDGAVLAAAFGTFVTFNFVALAWVLFVLPASDALKVYGRLGGAVIAVLTRLMGG